MRLHPLPPLESAWQTLRSSLEWAQEFGLVFVFCSDARAKQALFQRANDLMQAQVRPFQRPEIRQATDLPKKLLPLAINPASVHAATGMPLWLDLDGHPGSADWDQARREFLHRLNERRATLAREHTHTVVLALPLDWTKQAAEAAPDLWTIRQPSVYLDTQSHAQALQPFARTPDARPVAQERTPEHTAASTHLPAAVLRWQASKESGQAELSLWDATQASEAALASGHSELAWQIAQETVEHARTVIDKSGKTPKHLRDLAASMNNLGDVAQRLGRLEEAQQAFASAVQLANDLVESYGETAMALDTLAYGKMHLGFTLEQQGLAAEAQPHRTQARHLFQRLALAMPHDRRYETALRQLEAPPGTLVRDGSAS
ncbi:MAG: tetratricopeptide repeat protein [Rhodoferax sp.]|nr:tetratricopeptide repeat protein [Rhodoferax sp.]